MSLLETPLSNRETSADPAQNGGFFGDVTDLERQDIDIRFRVLESLSLGQISVEFGATLSQDLKPSLCLKR